jgi:CDP-glucose 4,6-dehydratase
MNWKGRSVLITGATGLVGTWLTRRLIELNASVVCLVRGPVTQDLRAVQGDIRDRTLLDRVIMDHHIDTVFHLAAQTAVGIANRNPVSTFETNIAGTWNILEACRLSPLVKSIVVASSDKAYGRQPILPYTEDMPLDGRHPYDASKSCADILAQTYAATYSLPVAITRCGNFYGGGDMNWNRLVPGTIRSILHGERPVIRSDGHYQRDYLYVEDSVQAYLTLASRLRQDPHLRGRAFNFSNESRVSVLEMVRLILRHMESTLEPDIRNESSNEIREQFLNAERARTDLGWRAEFTLEEGLRRTIAWYREYFAGGKDDRSRELAVAHPLAC